MEELYKKILSAIFERFPGFVDCQLIPSLTQIATDLKVNPSTLEQLTLELRKNAMEKRKKEIQEMLKTVSFFGKEICEEY